MPVQDIQKSVVKPDIIQHYHAHVYYDPASTRDRAARLRERVAVAFPGATLGRWHDTLVGPHTQSMYQIAFPPPLLSSFLPWLMLNRDGLSILLHPGTGDAYADHIDHAAAPEPQEMRAKKIGRVLIDFGKDRPWSQYFCCMAAANRDFTPVSCTAVMCYRYLQGAHFL